MIGTRPFLLLSLMLALPGCATMYGHDVGRFGLADIRSAGNVMDYRIIRLVDFRTTFPETPAQLPGTDSRLAAFMEPRPVSRTNEPAFSYKAGRYYLSYRCGNVQRFRLITIEAGSSAHAVTIGCTS